MHSTEQLTHPLTVTQKIQLTEDTFTFQLALPENLKTIFKYQAGQFTTLFLKINGEDVRRSYSFSSSPSIDSQLHLTVKRVLGGKVSNFLIDHIQVGDTLRLTPPAGHFVVPAENKKPLLLIAAGSGITPIYSLLKEALNKSSAHIYLLYLNRNESCIIFHRELMTLNSKYADRLKIEYVLSSPKKPYNGTSGRPTLNSLCDLLSQWSLTKQELCYICGPEAFMQLSEEALLKMGFVQKQIFKESFSFTAPAESNLNLSGATLIGDSTAQKVTPTLIQIQVDGELHSVPYSESATILDAAIQAGLNPPYSCMDGACMACLAKVQSGLVYQENMGILTDDYIENKECLTCQAKACSQNVRVSFDM